MINSSVIREIHDLNHTLVKRVGSVASGHYSDKNIINVLNDYSAGKQWSNLDAGIYRITIDSENYVFDLYSSITGDDYFEIDSFNKAFMMIAATKYPVVLYHIIDVHERAERYMPENTVNDFYDLLIVNGKSELSTIYGNGSPSINQPMRLTSVSTLTFSDRGGLSLQENIDVVMRNNIKSLPTGLKDLFVMDALFQKHYVIYRIGRETFTGSENWTELEDYCTDDYCVYFCPNTNVIMENKIGNTQCTHLSSMANDDILNTENEGSYIATCNDSRYGQGFIVKIPNADIGYNSYDDHLKYFKSWMRDILLSGNPMIVEYPLAELRTSSILLDEYHVQTYYAGSNLWLSNTKLDLSYCYKSLTDGGE